MELLVVYSKKGRPLKRWKLSHRQALAIMGNSKKTDIYLPSLPEPVFLGLQFEEGRWKLLNVSGALLHSFIERVIEEQDQISWNDEELRFQVLNKKPWYQEKAEQLVETSEEGVHRVLVVSLSRQGVRATSTYEPIKFKQIFSAAAEPKPHWQSLAEDSNEGERVIYRLVQWDPEAARLLKEPRAADRSAIWVNLAFWLIMLLGGASYLLLPQEKSTSEVALGQIPPKYEKLRTVELRAAAREAQPKADTGRADNSVAEAITASSNVAGASKETKWMAGSRLTKLMGRLARSNISEKAVQIVEGSASQVGKTGGPMVGSLGGVEKAVGASLSGGGGGVGSASEAVGQIGQALGQQTGRAIAQAVGQGGGRGGRAGVDSLEKEADVEGGGLDPEVIAAVIKKHLGEILYCYERQLSAQPDLYGKVAVKFIIGSSGQVDSARILQTSLNSHPVENCIQSRLMRWKFPEPKGANQVVVTYPFLFKNAR
jgi:hypothetical protein